MKKILVSTMYLVLIVLLMACAVTQTWDDMNYKQRAAWMNEIYNTQYDAYVAEVKAGNLSEERKEILQAKKKILTELWPILKTYSQYASTNEVPPIEIEAHAFRLVNLLIERRGYGNYNY